MYEKKENAQKFSQKIMNRKHDLMKMDSQSTREETQIYTYEETIAT